MQYQTPFSISSSLDMMLEIQERQNPRKTQMHVIIMHDIKCKWGSTDQVLQEQRTVSNPNATACVLCCVSRDWVYNRV